MVLKGSKEVRYTSSLLYLSRPKLNFLPLFQHYNECFEKFAHLEPKEGWTLEDNYVHDERMIEWLINKKGCTWHKVCCPEGGLILWDSR